jgi:hypothetical protein
MRVVKAPKPSDADHCRSAAADLVCPMAKDDCPARAAEQGRREGKETYRRAGRRAEPRWFEAPNATDGMTISAG